MCGLVGIAGNLVYKDEALMRRFLVFDYFRGTDSTGLAAIRNTGEVCIAKIASHPIDLFDTSKFKAALNGNNSKVFIGHNRAATRGNVNAINAHPYQFDHIVGAHNGTLDHSSVTALEKALGETFPVDSMAIFAGIAQLGVRETISMLRGAWAIVYYDTEKGTINFIRNKERPMFYAYSKDLSQLYWASEWPTINDAIETAGGYEFYEQDKTNHMFFPTDPDFHYSWDVDVLKKGGTTVPKPKISKMEGKPPAPPVIYHHQDNWLNPGGANGGNHNPFKLRTPITTGTNRVKGPTLLHLLGDIDNPFGGVITREQFDAWSKFGCSYCSSDVEWGEQGVTVYERDGHVLCPDCSLSQKNEANRVYLTDFTDHILTMQ